jgi:hypothetical protein
MVLTYVFDNIIMHIIIQINKNTQKSPKVIVSYRKNLCIFLLKIKNWNLSYSLFNFYTFYSSSETFVIPFLLYSSSASCVSVPVCPSSTIV